VSKSENAGEEAEADGDAKANADADGDAKAEADGDVEADADGDVEADGDADGDADAWDSEWDPEAEPDEDPEERAERIAAFEAAVEARARKVKRIVGAVMSVIVPGTGHFAVGRPKRGVFWFVAALLSTLLLPISVELFIAGLVGSVIASIVDLLVIDITTKKTPEWIAIALIWFGALLVAQFVRGGIFDRYAGGYHVPSASMVPTVLRGDSVVVYKRTRGSVGNVIVFRHPCTSKEGIARVIAGAGDKVEVRCGKLFVNGEAAELSATGGSCSYDDFDNAKNETRKVSCVRYRETSTTGTRDLVFGSPVEQSPRKYDFPTLGDKGSAPPLPACEGFSGIGTIEPVGKTPPTNTCAQRWRYVVPEGHVFVLGDNRDDSSDSRIWGPVRRTAIIGKVTEVWWSTGPSGLRLGRIGTNIH
jgi:signal peptidase I